VKTFRELSPRLKFIFGASWFLTLTILIVVLVLYTANKRTNECLSDYIVEDRRTSALRVEAGSEANAAETAFWIDFNKYVKATEAARAKALVDASKALDKVAIEKAEQAKVVAENPVPEVPKSCLSGVPVEAQ
jgi:hypothetical protein